MRPLRTEAHSPQRDSLPDLTPEKTDLTIQQLRDQAAQDTIALQIPSRLLELQRQFADKERLLQESQAAVCHKLQQAEHKISHLESALEQTQSELLKATSKADTNGSRSDELEMLMTDLDRANQYGVVQLRNNKQHQRNRKEPVSASQQQQQQQRL